MTTEPHVGRIMSAKGISVASLAEATNIPRMTLTRRLAEPSKFNLDELQRIAAALQTTVLDLLSEDAA